MHVELDDGAMCFDLHLNQAAKLTSFLDGLNFPSTNLISLDSRQRWYFVERYTNTQTFIFRPHHGLDGPPMPKAFAVMLAARINWVMNEIQENATLELEVPSMDSLAGARCRMDDNLRGIFR